MATTTTPTDATLSLALRAVGGTFIVFFTFAFVGSVTKMTEPHFLYEMLGWSSPGDPEEQMMAAIYVVWGAFLWRAAADNSQHPLFIGFTIAANAAHFAVMLVQALVTHGERGHLHGDVLLWGALVLALGLPWWSARRVRRVNLP